MSDDEIIEQAASSRGKPPGDSFEAFDLFRDYLENKLSDLKNDITKQTSKLKRKTPTFRLESHRIQFEFNTDILEGLESLSTNLKQQDSTIRKYLISKLKKRNKLIKVADRSPGGWATVREYEEPSLCGSDSEDDKKLKQAETRALKKIKLSHNQLSATVSSNNASDTNCSIFMPPDTSRRGVNYQPSGLSWGRGRGTFPIRGERRQTATASPTDICFGCGLTGHFRRSCSVSRNGPQGQSSWTANKLPAQGEVREIKPATEHK